MDDAETLARTIYGEARGELYPGKIAVGCVIANRARLAASYMARKGRPHPLYGNGTLASACQAPWQFSCWNAGDPNRAKLLVVRLTDPVMAICVKAARSAALGPDITKGSTHYYAAGSEPPGWAVGKTPAISIGHHLFFNNIN
jgi:spore germination cell wall hydrolase CwlJ-like protein